MPIYVVDDNPDVSEFLTFLLANQGYRVHAFCCPEDALSHMKSRQNKPDILITDFNMPKMNGYELHQQVSRHAPEVRTVMISGRALNDRVDGDFYFIQKPFQPDYLIKLVESLKQEQE